MRSILTLLATLLGLAALGSPAVAAPSFDCAKVKATLEKTICADAELSALDQKLADLFKSTSDALPAEDRAAFLTEQRKWLRGRTASGPEWEACAADDGSCLVTLYRERIEELTDFADHPAAAMANLFWSRGVVCKGNQALLRFRPGDDEMNTHRMPPDVGGALSRLPASGKECRLADGRMVRFKTASMQDELAYGECGGDSSDIYSVWIGDRKVVNREPQRGKCGAPFTVRALFLDGGKLTECRDIAAGPTDRSPKVECRDLTARLANPVKDDRQPGTFTIREVAPGFQPFCQRLIHTVVEEYADPGYKPVWPQKTALPEDAPDPEELRQQKFDLNNSGQAATAYLVSGSNRFFDGSFWLLPPPGGDNTEAQKTATSLASEPDLDAARKKGFQVFAGDQTIFKEARYTTLRPFLKDGKTYIHISWVVKRLDLPTEIVAQPQPDGSLKTVCAYLATPDL